MIRVGLVGVTGYTGMELARLLTGHPNMKLTAATSRTEAGKLLGDLYPFLNGLPGADVILIEPEPELIAKECDLAFLAVPHTAATEMAAALVERGLKVVDLSADFRLRDPATYAAWYKREHVCTDLLHKAVYGLPELYGADIARTSLVANPGCYPTATILGLYAAVKNNLVHCDDLVVDAKSGATGAGRKAAVPTLFSEVSDNFRAYGLPTHRHTPGNRAGNLPSGRTGRTPFLQYPPAAHQQGHPRYHLYPAQRPAYGSGRRARSLYRNLEP